MRSGQNWKNRRRGRRSSTRDRQRPRSDDIPARTEKLQINNTIAKPTHAQMLQNNVPKKYKPLSELTTHARKISAINNNKAKEVSRALPQRRTSIPTINTGR